MIQIRSTRNCVNTPRVLFVLEEAGATYETLAADDGHFRDAYGVAGPSFEDGGLVVVEIGAVLRHVGRAFGLTPVDLAGQAEVDRWIDFQHRRLAPALWPEVKRDEVIGWLRRLEQRLGDGPFLLGELSTADCSFAILCLPPVRARLPLDEAPAIAAWLDRLAARPAWARAVARTLR